MMNSMYSQVLKLEQSWCGTQKLKEVNSSYLSNSCLVAMTFKEHMSQINQISVQKTMKANYLVSGSQDTNAKLWDLRGKRSIYTLKPHPKPVTSVDLSVNASCIATCSANVIKIWDSGRQAFQFKDGESAVTQVAMNPVDMTLASGHFDRYLRYWDLSKGKKVFIKVTLLFRS